MPNTTANIITQSFSAKIFIIGVNPYVFVPSSVLKKLFLDAGKNTSPIQITLTVNGKKFPQNLVRYSGKWRLYLNTPMRKTAAKDVGDMIDIEIAFDPLPRIISMHPKLKEALLKNKAAHEVFKKLPPSRQKEIIRYISFLKTEETLLHNIEKAIDHLLGKQRFAGRD
jgi:hypothetical protein